MAELYLKDAASITLDLIAAAERDGDKYLDCLSRDAVAFIAAIWRSYLGSSRPQLWPSLELREIIIHITMILDSAKQFVVSGMKMRRSKFRVVRRFKVARDAPRMKLYRTQLAKCALMAQAEIFKLDPDNRRTDLPELIGNSQSAQLPESISTIEHEGEIMSEHTAKENIAPKPSARPTDDQAHRESKMGCEDQTYSGDDGPSEAVPEEIFSQWSVGQINIMFVSGSAVAIGGGDAHVHRHI